MALIKNEAKPTSRRNSYASTLEELTVSQMTQGIMQWHFGARRLDAALQHGGLTPLEIENEPVHCV
jgi:hypothetical protein